MSRRLLVMAAILTVIATGAFCAYMFFGSIVCGATGSSCGGFERQGNIALVVGVVLVTILFALAFRRPRPLVIPDPDPPPPSDGPYR